MKKIFKLVLAAVACGVIIFAGFKVTDFVIEKIDESSREPEVKVPEIIPGVNDGETGADYIRATVDEDGNTYSAVSFEDVSPIVDVVMPAVVSIDCSIPVEEYNIFGAVNSYMVQSSGSGFLVSQSPSQLFIVTNEHVIKDAAKVSVSFFDDTTVDATVVGSDTSYDLAIVSVPVSKVGRDTLSKIKIAVIGNSDNLRVGDKDIAIGNSLGYGMAVTVGHVSALNREINIDGTRSRPLLQTDAAINPGNSGGPLLDIYGQVIGINCAKYSAVDVEGIGYAIPINNVIPTINELINSFNIEDGEYGSLGIDGKDVTEGYSKGFSMPRGVYVYGINVDSHAIDSDLKIGDIITKVNGQEVLSYEYLKERISHFKAGSTVTLTVMRASKTKYVEVEINVVLDALE